jgi:succinate dehydrogenase/fumarate reductase flavoprotein subunit
MRDAKRLRNLRIVATAWAVTAVVGTVMFGAMAVAGMDARDATAPAVTATAAIVATPGPGATNAATNGAAVCAP